MTGITQWRQKTMPIGITKDRLNLRTKPGTDQPVLRVIPTGTQLNILATSGDWLQVQAPDGSTGYVATAFVDVQGAASTPTPAAAPAPTSAAAPAASAPTPVTVVVSNKLLTFAGDILHVRSAPAMVDNPDNKIETLQAVAQVQPLEDDASLSKKVGTTKDQNLWIHVQPPSGKQVYFAAWLGQSARETA